MTTTTFLLITNLVSNNLSLRSISVKSPGHPAVRGPGNKTAGTLLAFLLTQDILGICYLTSLPVIGNQANKRE